jgi:hypothetical protein
MEHGLHVTAADPGKRFAFDIMALRQGVRVVRFSRIPQEWG